MRNNATKTRGRPFAPGNAGRPLGSRHKVTRAVEALLDGEAEALTRKAISMALAGDLMALRICIDRICPPMKSRVIRLELPAVRSAADVLEAQVLIVGAMAAGDISLDEAKIVSEVLDGQRRAIEAVDLERRVAALERGQQGHQTTSAAPAPRSPATP